LFRTSAS
jgi:hypothetical protein